MGDKTINGNKEVSATFGREEGLQLGAHTCMSFWGGWPSALPSLAWWLPGCLLSYYSQYNMCIWFVRFCVSGLYFTMKTLLLMGLLGVHITCMQPYRNLASGVPYNKWCFTFFTQRKIGNSSQNSWEGLSGSLIRIEGKYRGPVDRTFLDSGYWRLLAK